MDEEEYFVMIHDYWRTHKVSWSEIMNYHKNRFENDVLLSMDALVEEVIEDDRKGL